MKKLIGYCLIFLFVIALAISSIPAPSIYKYNQLEIYDKDNNLINSQIENKPGEYVSLKELSPYVANAFIAFEDKNFYSHHGFDIPRMIKAFFSNLFSFSFSQGASTITQQYARTVFLSNKKTITRKIKEAYYTTKLEAKYSKEQILEGYLNSIYLGHGCYGIDAASKFYFNKSSKELSLVEAATLAALPSSPNNSSPFNNYKKAKERKNSVLKAMKEEGYIDLYAYKNALNSEIQLSSDHQKETNLNYYFDQVKEFIKVNHISNKKGIKVYTNLDTSLYEIALPIIDKYYLGNSQLSLVILENKTNHVLLDIGGYSYSDSSYNRSVYSKRQIGSTIKTFLYSLALENNFSTSTALTSEKVTFNIKDYGFYSPANSNDIYANKKITMKEAYAVSDNIYAVKTLLILGSDNFAKYLNKFNLEASESVPSIALGSCNNTLYDLVKAYSVYANNGYYYNYSFINKITDAFDAILYKTKLVKEQIVNKTIVEEIKSLMTLPFSNNGYYTKATLENYNIKNFYGKSGSTSSDSYLILFNDKYTIGIWIGNDDNSKLYDYTTSKYLLKDLTNYL